MTTATDIHLGDLPDLGELPDLAAAPTRVSRANPAARGMSPAKAVDFYELTKPRMNFLVLATTAVGFYMAVRGRGDWALLPGTLLGTALTAAGASVLNQFSERRLDAMMPRTRNRPLPAGRVDPAEALGYGVGMAVGGVAMLAVMVNPLTAALGAFTLLSYVLVYTPLKRRTTLNTVIGAIPGAIPPVMGYTAVRGTMSVEALTLFAILFVWQMPHFLAIAILYRRDYAAAGFRMLPVVDESLSATGRQIVLYAMALVPVSVLPAVLAMSGPAYFVAAALLSLGFLWFGVACAATKTRPDARKLFFASILYLPLLLAVMMVCRR